MGHTITPECSFIKTPENSPARFRMEHGMIYIDTTSSFVQLNINFKE